jgi:hypothetical protein
VFPRVCTRSLCGWKAVYLVLHDILDGRHLEDDIPQLATLTKLARLELLLCYGEMPLGTWWSGLQALTPLKKLGVILDGRLLERAQGLSENLRAVRKETGLPPTQFASPDLAFLISRLRPLRLRPRP